MFSSLLIKRVVSTNSTGANRIEEPREKRFVEAESSKFQIDNILMHQIFLELTVVDIEHLRLELEEDD